MADQGQGTTASPPAPGAPAPGAAPPLSGWSHVRAFLGNLFTGPTVVVGIASAALTATTSLVAISGDAAKSLFQGWLSRCTIVLDVGEMETAPSKDPFGNYRIPITISGTGKAPSVITLLVSSNMPVLKTMLMGNDFRANNRAANTLPKLSQAELAKDPQVTQTIRYEPYHTNMRLRAHVYLSEAAVATYGKASNPVQIAPFIGFEADDIKADRICRVEEAGFLNRLLDAGAFLRFMTLFVVAFLVGGACTVLLARLTRK